jgi:N-acetylmuramoyl-L-alanine amidase
MKILTRCAAVAMLVSLASISFAVTAELCLDPGHGGTDPGATSCGATPYEKTNVLNTINRFKAWLDADTNNGAGGGSWAVVRTRTSDATVSLATRVAISNNNASNRFMSIHNNAFNCSANGTETFCYGGGSTNSFDMRNKVQNRMIQAWARVNRGNKTANFYVLVNTAAPAELAELGFLDSSVDRPYTNNSTQQDKAGKYHLYAIQNHYGKTAFTP